MPLEQRRWFAGTDGKPQVLFCTRTGTTSNLTSSLPARDADALDAPATEADAAWRTTAEIETTEAPATVARAAWVARTETLALDADAGAAVARWVALAAIAHEDAEASDAAPT